MKVHENITSRDHTAKIVGVLLQRNDFKLDENHEIMENNQNIQKMNVVDIPECWIHDLEENVQFSFIKNRFSFFILFY